MPDAFGNPTEEELAALAIRQGRMSPAMRDPYAPSPQAQATASFAPRERRLAEQMRAGREMLATGPAQGRQTGRIYAAPTWADIAASAVRQGIGGLEMRQARQGQRRLDEDIARAEQRARQMEVLEEGQEDVQAELERKRGLQQAVRARQQELTDRRIDRAQDIEDVGREEAFSREETATAHANRMELERLRAELDEEDVEVPSGLDEDTAKAIKGLGSAGERKTASMLLSTTNKLADLEGTMQTALDNDENWSSPAADFAAETAGNLFGDTARNIAKSRAYNENEKAIRGFAADAVEAYRRARTGANLTGVEIKVGEDWDPTAPGIGPEESYRRTVALNEAVRTALTSMGVPTPDRPKQRAAPEPTDPSAPAESASAADDYDNMTDEELERLFQQRMQGG